MKVRMADDVFKKRQIGGHTTNTELAQCTIHSANSFLGSRCPGSDFLEKWIVEAADHGTRVGRATVQTNTKTCGTAIRCNAPVVRHKIVLRILGGNTTLNGVSR